MPKEVTRVEPAALLARLLDQPRDDRTGDRILAAAGEVLLASGLEAFELDDVARRAGVGRSTVYRRFGDRNGLIVAALAAETTRFFTALADVVAPAEDVVDEVVAAFCAGLRVARARGLDRLLRTDTLLLRLLTVDGHPVVRAARDHLAALAVHRHPGLDHADATRVAELLVRLAISFVLVPETAFDADGDISEEAVRRHLAPLVAL